MLLKDFLPHPKNRHIARLYRIVHFKFDAGMLAMMKAYPPRPEQVLSFFPLEPETVQYGTTKIENNRCILVGQHDCVLDRFVRNEFLCFQVVFQPSGLHLLTGLHGTEVRNQYLHAEHFFPSHIRYINEQLYEAKSYEQMIAIVDRFVASLRLKKDSSRFDGVANQIINHHSNVSLDWLADQSALSTKQFERNFKARTGVSPKKYLRITRFDKAFRLRNQFSELDWLSIAIQCGYYDYQHLAKDYRDFTGLSPVAFHAVEDKAPERVFGLHEGYYDTSIT